MSNSTVTISGNDPSFEHEAGQLFGPCIFGWCLQLILAGLTVSMAWHWFNARRAEKRAIKALVAGALAFNLASAGLNFAQIYRRGTLVPEENYSPLYFYTPSILAPIFISGASVCTHGYLGYRTWKLLHSNKLYGLLNLVLLVLQSITAIVLTTISYLSFSHDYDTYSFALYQVWLWLMAFTDVQIATVLTWQLKKLQTGFSTKTDDIVLRVIKVSVQCALLPTLFTLTASIVYATTYGIAQATQRPLLLHALALAFIPAIPSLHCFSLILNLSLRPIPGDPNAPAAPQAGPRDFEASLANDAALSFPLPYEPEMTLVGRRGGGHQMAKIPISRYSKDLEDDLGDL